MTLKPFQRADLARAALHDGLILAWDTGLGKTWATFLWPLLKVGYDKRSEVTPPLDTRGGADLRITPNSPVLIIAPGDLHQQIIEEALTNFRLQVIPIDSQNTYLALLRPVGPVPPPGVLPLSASDGERAGERCSIRLPPNFYITSYTQLATNGVAKFPSISQPPSPNSHLPLAASLHLTPAHFQAFFDGRARHFAEAYRILDIKPEATLAKLEACRASAHRELDGWPNQQAAANQRTRVNDAYALLRNLFTIAPNPTYAALSPNQQNFIIAETTRQHLDDCSQGIGSEKTYHLPSEERGHSCPPAHENAKDDSPPTAHRAEAASVGGHISHHVRCLYSPSLADLCHDAFSCVVVDEGVKMKGEATLIGRAVRLMNPPFRLVLTATPIKNRLTDIFLLAWWAAGAKDHAHARFPYKGQPEDIEDFAATFLVTERNLSCAAQKPQAKAGRRVKRTAEVCNIHRLWKLFAPIILRRRKQEVGEAIVPKHRHVIRVPMGRAQADTYRYHLEADYRDTNDLPAIGARLQALRLAAVAPDSHLLAESNCVRRPPPNCHRAEAASAGGPCRAADLSAGGPISHHSYTPKIATALNLILQCLRRGEQVLLGSAFTDPLRTIAARLREAGVPHAIMDGSVSQARRGQLSAQFKAGKTLGPNSIPVVLAGVECMAEGHNFWRCPNAILISYSWAHDKFEQFINRIHRLLSQKPVNVWSIICHGSIDRVLEESIHEKGDSSELVIDGKLVNDRPDELSLADLLKIAEKEFDPATQTIEESTLQAEWPNLRAQLTQAFSEWHDTDPGRARLLPSLPTPQLPSPTSQLPSTTFPPISNLKSQIPNPALDRWRARLTQRHARLTA